MSYDNQIGQTLGVGTAFSRATIVKTGNDGVSVSVEREGDDAAIVCCDVIENVAKLPLASGDEVLVWMGSGSKGSRPIIIGRVTHRVIEDADVPEMPDTLVLEAKQSLTLRVGEGSITIREDGKILIKGKDLVSHAQRMNRIKGGAVSIN